MIAIDTQPSVDPRMAEALTNIQKVIIKSLQYLEEILEVIVANDRVIVERQNLLRQLNTEMENATSEKTRLQGEISELEKCPQKI